MAIDDDLQAACYEVARTTMWDRRPVDVDDIRRVAESFYREAKDQVDYLERMNYPPVFVVRAVRYLGSTHAIPPMRDDVHWFHDMLSLLVELACPNSGSSSRDVMFYRELVHSLTDTLAEIAAPEEMQVPAERS